MEIYLITPPDEPFLEELLPVLRAGVDRLQYRRPSLRDRSALNELEEVRERTEKSGVDLVVNDRPDLALAVGAECVHLGEEDLPVDAVKDRWPELEVGRTQRVEEPLHPSADYLGVGPVFSSPTKDVEADTVGWSGVSTVLERTEKPVYAVGGITPERCEGAPDGLAGVAVIAAVWEAPDPVRAVESLRDRLE